MENIFRSRNLKRIKYLLVFLLCQNVYSQNLILEDSVAVQEPNLMSIDRAGNIYLTDIKGNVYKYGSHLKDELIYSPDKPARITSIEAWQGLRVFCFYRDIQEYALLDRFLTTSINYSFDDPQINFISQATISFDNKLWLIDQPSMSLIKYDIQTRKIEFTKPLELTISSPFNNILLFREYKNKIYIIDEKNGMFIFDNLGNFQSIENFDITGNVGFFEDYFFFQSDSHLVFKDLFSSDSYKMEMPDSRASIAIIKYADLIYILGKKYLFKYRAK